MSRSKMNLLKATVVVGMGAFALMKPAVAAASTTDSPLACVNGTWCVDSCDDPSLFYNCDACVGSPGGSCREASPTDCCATQYVAFCNWAT